MDPPERSRSGAWLGARRRLPPESRPLVHRPAVGGLPEMSDNTEIDWLRAALEEAPRERDEAKRAEEFLTEEALSLKSRLDAQERETWRWKQAATTTCLTCSEARE